MDASYALEVVSYFRTENRQCLVRISGSYRVEEQVTKAKCDCCGLCEEYTPNYIKKIKESHSGSWVCGLCSEAVGEMIRRGAPYVEMKEALEKHREFFQEFNGTTRANPKLALTSTMRKIARRSSEYKREIKDITKIARSSSCIPRMNN
ncbi:hypothetical protein Leryth_010710 [Lithospermum erythrorhizon]|nr:hypothetical protein Leryth_010710 [Lithospermum erythrorhizon]